jgi:hypothetical protein
MELEQKLAELEGEWANRSPVGQADLEDAAEAVGG